MIVKVCGINELKAVAELDTMAVDFLGFIFYNQSKRNLKLKAPLPITSARKVGVFVNEKSEIILEKARRFGLDYLQLHGDEPVEQCKELSVHFPVIKAFNISERSDFLQTGKYESVCKYFLFDAKGPSYGGNGVAFDWSVLSHYKGQTPFLLSGGLKPEMAEKLMNLTSPYLIGVDINSGFEIDPGMKNIELVKKFTHELRS